MKAFKYVVSGALALCLAAPIHAQVTDYKTLLEPISKQLKASPNNLEAAKDLVKNYTKVFKKDPEAMVALGNAYLGVKNYAKASEIADLVLAKNRTYGDAFVLKGDIEAMKDDGGEAAMWYQQAMTQDPKNPNGYMSYANIYRSRYPEEAARALEELRKNIPDFPVEAEAAHTFYSTGNYEKAIEYFDKSNPAQLSESRLGEYILTALSLNKFDQGLEISQIALQKFPNNNGFVRLALINGVGAKKYAEALKYANQLLNSGEEKNAGDYTYYGQALAGNGQYDEAIAQYEKAFQLDYTNYKPLQYISEAYAAKGDEDKALEYSQKYLSLNPNAKISEYNKLAGIYLAKVKKGIDPETNFNKAMGVYEEVARKYPQAATWARSQKANEAFKLEWDDKAMELYKEVIADLENKADRDSDEDAYLQGAYRNVGYIYWSSKNDLEAARPYFEKLIKLDPDNSLAKKALGLDQPAESQE